jgi:hypothetical protein
MYEDRSRIRAYASLTKDCSLCDGFTGRSAAVRPAARRRDVVAHFGEVARRAGHGVDVLLKIYAGCIKGGADSANQRIEDALKPNTPELGPRAHLGPS